MSGGHFDYQQFAISNIADTLEQAIKENKTPDEYGYCTNFSKQTIREFKKTLEKLRVVQKEVMRIDWLLSGDDGEETYLSNIKEDKRIRKVKIGNKKHLQSN